MPFAHTPLPDGSIEKSKQRNNITRKDKEL